MRDLDVKDREILDILSKEARIALKALAARIGLSRSCLLYTSDAADE